MIGLDMDDDREHTEPIIAELMARLQHVVGDVSDRIRSTPNMMAGIPHQFLADIGA